jgi:hypothetical protein
METDIAKKLGTLRNELVESMVLNGMTERDARQITACMEFGIRPRELKCYFVTLTCIYAMLPEMPETGEFNNIRRRLKPWNLFLSLPKMDTVMNILDRINEYTLNRKKKETEGLGAMRFTPPKSMTFGKIKVIGATQANPGMIN